MDWLLNEMTADWLFWVVAGGLAAIGTAGAAYAAQRVLRATEAADGTVVGLEEMTDSEGVTASPRAIETGIESAGRLSLRRQRLFRSWLRRPRVVEEA